MDSISLLLEASEVHSRAEEYSRRASFDDTMCVESQSPEIEAIDAILHLRDSFQHNRERLYGSASNSPVPSVPPPTVKAEDNGFVRPERARRRAMSEPWVTMSPSFTRSHGAGASHLHGGRQSGMTTFGEQTNEGAYSSAHFLHPQLLQPRFPLPVLDPFAHSSTTSGANSMGSLGNAANRVPTMEEFAAIANKNGRIGIYTKEEREFLIHRFRDKKKRRVWKKKIRYECRKDLADRRCRVKGRFVKAAPVAGKHHHANSISSDNTSEETNHSRSNSLGHHDNNNNNNRLVFRIPRRTQAAASAPPTSAAHGTKTSTKKRPLKPLLLNMLSSSEDRLKYLTSILGEFDPNSPTPQDDLDDEEDHHEDMDDDMDDDMDEDDDEEDTEDTDEMDTSNNHIDKPEPRYRTRANSEHSLDYRRVRRHSIAY